MRKPIQLQQSGCLGADEMEPVVFWNLILTAFLSIGGWPVDPLAEVDPAFVSLTAV